MNLGRAIVLSAFAGTAVSLLAQSASAYAIWNASGVWDKPNNKRITYDPTATPPKIGNMSTGVLIKFDAAPAAAQAGAVAAYNAGYAPWQVLGIIPGVRINFQPAGMAAPNVTNGWGAVGTPGQASVVNASTMSVKLWDTRTLRTDGWNFDFAGTRPNNIDEYDVSTVAVHEVGHVLGLDHPGAPPNRIMNGSNVVRQAANGQWRPYEQNRAGILAIDPAVKDLAGGALPAATLGYKYPRNPVSFFSDTDTLKGALTLYSAPKSWIRGLVVGASSLDLGSYTYSYELENQAAHATINTTDGDFDVAADYHVSQFTIPVPDGITITNVTLPTGWTSSRDASGLHVSPLSLSEGGVAPGEILNVSFDSSMPPTFANPSAYWSLPSLEAAGLGQDDDHDGGDLPGMSFDPMHWAPGNNPFLFADFNPASDSWDLQSYSMVPIPVPTPGVLALASLAGLVTAKRRRSVA